MSSANNNLDSVSEKEFLTAREAASFLRVTLATVYNLTYRRRIPFFKPGGKTVLFRRDDLRAFIESARVPAKGAR